MGELLGSLSSNTMECRSSVPENSISVGITSIRNAVKRGTEEEKKQKQEETTVSNGPRDEKSPLSGRVLTILCYFAVEKRFGGSS